MTSYLPFVASAPSVQNAVLTLSTSISHSAAAPTLKNTSTSFLCPIDTSSHGGHNGPFLQIPTSSVGYFELPPDYDDAAFQRTNGLGRSDEAKVLDGTLTQPSHGVYSVKLCVTNPNITENSGIFFAPVAINSQGDSAAPLLTDAAAVNPGIFTTGAGAPAAAGSIGRPMHPVPLKLSVFGGTDADIPANAAHGYSSIGTWNMARGGDRYTNIFNAYSNIYANSPYRAPACADTNNASTQVSGATGAAVFTDGAGFPGTTSIPLQLTSIITPPNQPFLLSKGRGYFTVQCYLPPAVNVGTGFTSGAIWRRMGPVRWMYMVVNPGMPASNIPLQLLPTGSYDSKNIVTSSGNDNSSVSGGIQPVPNQV